MKNKVGRELSGQIQRIRHQVNWLLANDMRESVFFYTFHKCASTLFSSYVLRNLKGLRHVDYASRIYRGKAAGEPDFRHYRYVYGPLRLSLIPASPEYTQLVSHVDKPEFIRDRIAIFLLRDPRDILVSAYFSFGYSHGLSPVSEIRELQQRIRKEIQEQTIDEYALKTADRVLHGFNVLHKLNKACARSSVLRYEDMVEDWERFAGDLTRFVGIRDSVLMQIYARSRPVATENVSAHRRSGKPGGFRSKLTKETIATLNRKFAPVLERYQYAP